MFYLVLFFGAMLVLIGAAVIVRPDAIFGWMRRQSGSLGIHVVAVVVRLILGGALIVYAPESRFPVTLAVLGWITVAAAITLAVMGRTNFQKLMQWAMTFTDRFGRVAGTLALLMGAFLIYAVLP